MEERNELKAMMNEIVCQVSEDASDGVARFLQANPYSSFEYYHFRVLKNNPYLFENTLYCESENSMLYKKQICKTLDHPNGKNTFFLVGYQGCGKSTFIHSVINMYVQTNSAKTILIDCDKDGKNVDHVKSVICTTLKDTIYSSELSDFIDFFEVNYSLFDRLNISNIFEFYKIIKELNENGTTARDREGFDLLRQFINKDLSVKEAFYLLLFWNLASNFHYTNKVSEKIIIFVDNLDCIDTYSELAEFISCLDSLTVDMSKLLDEFKINDNDNATVTYVSKFKIFVTMRETTKANLPSSHFSDAFRSIYINKDMTEWYDKGEIIKKRINQLKEYNVYGQLTSNQQKQLQLLLKVVEDSYTEKVIYSLFNNNYRSAVSVIVNVIATHFSQLETYMKIMNYNLPQYKHGARGILFKCIFDEFNKSDGNEESCFKRIGVLDLLNRKNNSVSICRLILSYLSNYTETKCDSGKNSISLQDIIEAFNDIFPEGDVIKTLCEMFELRDTVWSHLVSFNQIEYDTPQQTFGRHIDVSGLDRNRTMLHYSCAGKIYIEYVATHFEFFTVRIFKERRNALFCDDNLRFDPQTSNYRCCDIINNVFDEVERCCQSLRKFNKKLCRHNNFLNPYNNNLIYLDSPYICMFKRLDVDGRERRFKQFHEERIIIAHINYIDCYRLYVINSCNILDGSQKVTLNELLSKAIEKYVNLLASDEVLKTLHTSQLIEYYKERLQLLQNNWENFSIVISKND